MGVNLQKVQDAKAALDAKAAQRAAGGARFWKAGVGNNRIRILPPWTHEGHFADDFAREVAVHWNVGEQNQRFLCPQKSPGLDGPCPLCDAIEELRKTGDPADQEMADTLRARTTYYSNIIDIEDPVYTQKDVDEYKQHQKDKTKEVPFKIGETKVQVYGYGPSVYEKIVNLFAIFMQDLTDLKTGRDVVITRKGTDKNNTRYDAVQADPSPVKIIGELKLTDLDAFQQPAKLEDMQGAVAGLTGGPSAPPPPQVSAPPEPPAPPKSLPQAQTLPPAQAQATAAAAQPAAAATDDEAPECFGDAEVWSQTDAECVGGAKEGNEFDPCPFFQQCGVKCGKLSAEPAKPQRRRRRAATAGASAADSMEAQMQAALNK